MMTIEVDQISPSPSGLRVGCVVHYSKDGPVRFVGALIPWHAFGKDVRQEMLAVFNKIRDDFLDSEPLF
jgi:hypothetical protein